MKIRKLGVLSMFIGVLISHAGLSSAFTVDTSSLNGSMSGLWNNANEPGWGATVTHQYNKIFATFYTYESDGTPAWYVASDCSVTADGCTGELYSVNGATPLTSPWNGANKAVKSVGNVRLSFSNAIAGSIAYTINGVSGTKSIEKSVFASAPVSSSPINMAKSEKLVGGTWKFSYTISTSAFSQNYTLASVNSTPTSGDYYAPGKDAYGDMIVGAYSSSLDKWILLDPTISFDRFYTFTFTDDDHVSGCYYQISPSGSTNLSSCYAMTGTRSTSTALAKSASSQTKESDAEVSNREIIIEAAPGFIEHGADDAYLLLRKITQ